MIGVIDVGGGLRGIYGAGVFDYCLDEQIKFDYCIGVSAGSANIASYTTGQRGRNYRFFTDYTFRKEYMSLSNMIKSGSYIGVDYIYGTLSNSGGEDPLGYAKMKIYPGIIKTVATNALTGEAKYFEIGDYTQDDYSVLKASCSLPVVCKPYFIGGVPYYDGGVSDPVPLEKAFADGCEKAVLILTKPIETSSASSRNSAAAKILKNKYPNTSAALMKMAEKYETCVKKALELQQQGKVLIIAPDNTCGMSTLTKDKAKIDAMYRKGYSDAEKIKNFQTR